MQKTVSVIIPVYNTGISVSKCVESILNNSYKELEVLLVDDGSEKETADICDNIAKSDQRVRVIHQKNTGVSGARNRGIENSKGEFITFVDADDVVEPDLIMTLVNDCIENNADISMCGYKECYEDNRVKEFNNSGKRILLEKDDILKKFFCNNKIGWNVWGKLYKRSIIGNVRFVCGKKTAEDMFFLYEVLKNSKTLYINEIPLYSYVKQSNSAMADENCTKFFDTFELITRVFEDKTVDEKFRGYQRDFYTKYGLWFMRFILSKDKHRRFKKDIANTRYEFLHKIGKIKNILRIRDFLELIMLKYAFPIYRLYCKFYGIKKGI